MSEHHMAIEASERLNAERELWNKHGYSWARPADGAGKSVAPARNFTVNELGLLVNSKGAIITTRHARDVLNAQAETIRCLNGQVTELHSRVADQQWEARGARVDAAEAHRLGAQLRSERDAALRSLEDCAGDALAARADRDEHAKNRAATKMCLKSIGDDVSNLRQRIALLLEHVRMERSAVELDAAVDDDLEDLPF